MCQLIWEIFKVKNFHEYPYPTKLNTWNIFNGETGKQVNFHQQQYPKMK